jgi:hypothetical protein
MRRKSTEILDGTSNIDEKANGWLRLAGSAEMEIRKAQKRIDDLKSAARIFRNNAAKGEPFPVEAGTEN